MGEVIKSFRYRVYPSASQVRRLGQWEGALRFLWNLAHEQRLLGLARHTKVYPSAFDQQKEMTELRAELPWLADVPRDASAELLNRLYTAWRRFFNKNGQRPKWKCKGVGSVSFCEPHAKSWRLDDKGFRFPKLGYLRLSKELRSLVR